MTRKKIRQKPKGASGVHSPHAIFAPALRDAKHGLYRDLSKIDGRTRIALVKKTLKRALLEGFSSPAPPVAQIIAERAALKLIRVASYETFILQGGEPAPGAERDYLALAESIRRDILTLFQLNRDSQPKELGLWEYLATKSGKGAAVIPLAADDENQE